MTTNNSPGQLLGDFASPSLDQWRQEVERLLKGAPFAKKMFTKTWEGITIAPLYTEADTQNIPWLETMPGQAPFVRGNHAAGYHAVPWLVAQEHLIPTCEDFNRSVRQALESGQTAVHLVFDQAGRQGKDPDQVSADKVGRRGTSVSSLADLATALDGIDLARYPVLMQPGASFLPAAGMLAALVKQCGGDIKQLQGCLGSDPYAALAQNGFVNSSLDQIKKELAVVTKWAVANAPGLRTLSVSEKPWHEGGADLALSLGLTLSSAVATLRAMESQGVAPEVVAPHFQFNLDTGTDFFMELAKLRALRLLWSRILTASGVPAEQTRTFIHCRTAYRSQTKLDAHVNLLRSTTEAMSAVLGGTDSLHVCAFDEVDWTPDEFSRRIARNVHLVLAHECHLDQVADPAGGSWYVESLTRDLAEAAWARFQAVEAAGGMPAVLASGWAQEEVAAAAEARAEGYAQRRDVLVGTNMYPDPDQTVCPVPLPGCDALHRRRTESLADQRTSETQEAHMLVLSHLEKVMDCPADQLFDLVTNAVAAGATLGELTGVMQGQSAPGLEVKPIPVRRDGEPFEKLRQRLLAARDVDKSAARVFTANLGDFARYMPRLEFARGFFQVGGFEVVGEEFFTDPVTAVAAAQNSGARVVVLVGLDATYTEHAVAAARGLADGPEPPLVILAGASGDLEAELCAAGVVHFVHVRSNILEVLNAVLTRLEGQS